MILQPSTTAASETSPFLNVKRLEAGVYRIVQCLVTAAGLVQIQGRLSADMPWHVIESFTESDAKSVALFTHMRVAVTGNTGTVRVEIDLDQ